MGDSYNEVTGLLSLNNDNFNPCLNMVNTAGTLSGNQTIRSKQQTSSHGTVVNSANIKLKSENRVKLNSGFKAESGSQLKVRIESCD